MTISPRYPRKRQRKWDDQHMASATCRLRAEDYRALQMAAMCQNISPAYIIRHLIGAYLAIIGTLPKDSPLWGEIQCDKRIIPYFRKKKWDKPRKMGVKAKKVHDKIVNFPASEVDIDSTRI